MTVRVNDIYSMSENSAIQLVNRDLTNTSSQTISYTYPRISRRFYFHASRTTSQLYSGYSIIVFDKVFVNDYGSYDPNAGFYKIPIAGMYYFHANILHDAAIATAGQVLDVRLMTNFRNERNDLTAGYAGSRLSVEQAYCQLSVSYLGHFNAGSYVYVTPYQESTVPVYGTNGAGHSHFYGWRVA